MALIPFSFAQTRCHCAMMGDSVQQSGENCINKTGESSGCGQIAMGHPGKSAAPVAARRRTGPSGVALFPTRVRIIQILFRAAALRSARSVPAAAARKSHFLRQNIFPRSINLQRFEQNGPKGSGKPIAHLFARRTFDLPWYSLTHSLQQRSFSFARWQRRRWTDGRLEVTFR